MSEEDRRSYIAIDLKSFYASVECVERGLDPLGVNLVVADPSRTEKTICLSVTPALKARGVPSRPRLFEVIEQVAGVNAERRAALPGRRFSGKSYLDSALRADPSLAMDYIIAPPRMALYMDYSARIYQIYLKYIAEEDIHVYSVDEVFIDATRYLRKYHTDARGLAMRMIRDVLHTTGITATAGIGTNMYLCKVAMDIVAKKMPPDADGVRVAELDELSYRRELWDHRPLTDFWRIGHGIAAKLADHGICTMGDIARCSLGGPGEFYSEALLYRLFGVNAELLIDHAWGWESCTIADVKAYRPQTNSVSTGQVLKCPYDNEQGRLIVREMADVLVLDLAARRVVTDQLTLDVCYDTENLADPVRRAAYTGRVAFDYLGREVPVHAHGTANLDAYTSSTRQITAAVAALYDRITDKNLTVRRLTVTACRVVGEDSPEAAGESGECEQLDVFTDYAALDACRAARRAAELRERAIHRAILDLRGRYGNNVVVRGMNFIEGGTTLERNTQIGGHRA